MRKLCLTALRERGREGPSDVCNVFVEHFDHGLLHPSLVCICTCFTHTGEIRRREGGREGEREGRREGGREGGKLKGRGGGREQRELMFFPSPSPEHVPVPTRQQGWDGRRNTGGTPS